MLNKNQNKTFIVTYGGLFFGLIAGCVFLVAMLCLDGFLWLDIGLEKFDFSSIKEISDYELGIHLFGRRCVQIIIFILMVFLTTYMCASFCYCSWFGLYFGYVLCDLIIKYGVYGFCYGVCCFFPHYLFYFIVIYLIGKWKTSSLNNYYKIVNKWNIVIKIIVIFILFLLAFVWEWKIQKNFLNYFFQYLV